MSGERIRDFNLIEQLARCGWRVSLFSLDARGTLSAPDETRLRQLCEDVLVYDFRGRAFPRLVKLAASVVLRRPYYSAYASSSAAVEAFRSWLTDREPNAVVVGQLFMQPYVPAALLPIAVLDCHNAEAYRLRTMSKVLGMRPKGLVARSQVEPVRRLELRSAQQCARVLAVSASEQAYFEAAAPGRVSLIPNGVDCDRYRPRSKLPPEPRILHMGSLDYTPTVDGFTYLIREILPHVRRPGATLTVIGSNPRRQVAEIARRSPIPPELVGQVSSTGPYLERSRLLAVPLRFGGGTRLKILEALACGVPVVTTTIGCEGLGVEHERHCLIADDPIDFAEAIERLFADDDLCRRLAAHGRELVEARYDWASIGERLHELLLEVSAASMPATIGGGRR